MEENWVTGKDNVTVFSIKNGCKVSTLWTSELLMNISRACKLLNDSINHIFHSISTAVAARLCGYKEREYTTHNEKKKNK